MRPAGFIVAVGCVAPVQGAYILANLQNSGAFNACGSVNPLDPGEPCAGLPDIRPVAVAGQSNGGNGSAQTDYGINKVIATSGAGGGMNAYSEWMVVYGLAGGQAGSTVDLVVTLAYDVTVIAGLGTAGFRMVVNNDFFGPYDIRTTTDGFLGDSCFDRPGQNALGACAGNHNGTVSRIIQATINPNNRLTLLVSASTFGSATADAFNTVTVQSVIVPDGISWSYNGLAGNPLNFQYAPDTSGVPEPAGVVLAGLGLIAAGTLRRRCSTPTATRR